MEQFNSNNLEEQSINPEQLERQDLLMRQGDIEAFEGLERLGNIDATRDIVSAIASNNPIFSENLGSLQNNIGNSFISEMSKSVETQNEGIDTKSDMLNYFSLDTKEIGKLQVELKEVGLDIFNVLNTLQECIEDKLNSLPEKYKEKIKTSIGRKTLDISDIVTEMKNKSISAEDFKNKRWILDEKIGDAYNFYTSKLFPTLQVKFAIGEGKEIPEITQKPFLGEGSFRDGTKYNNPRYVNLPSYMEEIDELLNASVDNEGNFDEGFFSTQSLLENSDNAHKALFDDMGIETIDNVSLLNDKDKEIQTNAMIAYFILIGVQMIPYLGAPISLGVDGVDTFSSHDGTLELGKNLGIINDNFQMEKEWYDNALGGIGLALTAVGLQGISRGKKLADSFVSLEKIGFGRIEEALQTFGNKLGISGEKLQSISAYLKSLFKGDIDEAKDGGKIDDGVDINKIDIPDEVLKKLEQLGIPREFYELVEGSDLYKIGRGPNKGKNKDIIQRFEALQNKTGVDLNTHINKILEEIPELTQTEAFIIFSYTDDFLYRDLNQVLRSNIKLTPEQQKLVDTLNSGLEKMPNYPTDTILLRGDNYKDYLQEIGTEVPLNGYTSVSSKIEDTFIGEDYTDNFLIEIKGLEGRIKDISQLAFFTNFAESIGKPRTINEGVILSGSKIEILDKGIKSRKIKGEMRDVLTITVKQIK